MSVNKNESDHFVVHGKIINRSNSTSYQSSQIQYCFLNESGDRIGIELKEWPKKIEPGKELNYLTKFKEYPNATEVNAVLLKYEEIKK